MKKNTYDLFNSIFQRVYLKGTTTPIRFGEETKFVVEDVKLVATQKGILRPMGLTAYSKFQKDAVERSLEIVNKSLSYRIFETEYGLGMTFRGHDTRSQDDIRPILEAASSLLGETHE